MDEFLIVVVFTAKGPFSLFSRHSDLMCSVTAKRAAFGVGGRKDRRHLCPTRIAFSPHEISRCNSPDLCGPHFLKCQNNRTSSKNCGGDEKPVDRRYALRTVPSA